MSTAQPFARRGVPSLELLSRYLAQPLFKSQPEDERFTTPGTLAWCLEQLGLQRYTEDVAACRESHHAPAWFGLDHPNPARRNGLASWWSGDSFGNVPFSQWGHWIATAWLNFLFAPAFRTHSMILPNDRTEQAPWHDLLEPFRDGLSPWLRTRYMRQRTKYSAPGMKGEVIRNATKNGGSPFFSSVVVLWSRDPRMLNLSAREPRVVVSPVPRRSSPPVLPRSGTALARRVAS